MRQKISDRWVVYLRPVKGHPEALRAVCEQREWEALELAHPGVYTLVQADIMHEGEAEILARGTSGAVVPRNSKQAIVAFPNEGGSAKARGRGNATEPAGPS